MCDYCGCRNNEAIDELSQEHEQVLDLIYGLRRAARQGDHAGAVRLLDELAPLLDLHSRKEEQGLFAQLRSRWGADGRLDDLTREHRSFAAGIDAVVAGGPDWPARLEHTLRTLSEHIMAEETDLFPYAMYELGDHEWGAVADVHRALATGGVREPAA